MTCIAREGLVISSDQEGNDKTRNKNKEEPLPDGLASLTPVIVSAIDSIRNILDIYATCRYVSKTVATNVDRDFIETVVVALANKDIIFKKPTPQGLDSFFIVNAEENLEVMNSTIADENVNSSSSILMLTHSFPIRPFSTP